MLAVFKRLGDEMGGIDLPHLSGQEINDELFTTLDAAIKDKIDKIRPYYSLLKSYDYPAVCNQLNQFYEEYHNQRRQQAPTRDLELGLQVIRSAQNKQYKEYTQSLTEKIKRLNQLKNHLKQSLIEAYALSLILSHLYEYYLQSPREVGRLKNDQDLIKGILFDPNLIFHSQQKKNITSTSEKLRDTTNVLTFIRKFIVRMRLFFVVLSNQYQHHRHWWGKVDKPFLNISLSYLMWVFCLPRFIFNFGMLIKNVCLPEEMKGVEIKWYKRLELELKHRWKELAEDGGFIVAGLLNCFIPQMIFIAISLQAYEFILHCTKAYVEIRRLNGLKRYYENLLEKVDQIVPAIMDVNSVEGENTQLINQNVGLQFPISKEDIRTHLNFLDKSIKYEKRKLALNLVNSFILLAAVCCALPMLVFTPLLPVILAGIGIVSTSTTYVANRILEKSKPPKYLHKYSMFKPELIEQPERRNSALLTASLFSSITPSTSNDNLSAVFPVGDL